MAQTGDVEIFGFDDIEKRLKELSDSHSPTKAFDTLRSALLRAGRNNFFSAIASATPVDTGETRDRVRVDVRHPSDREKSADSSVAVVFEAGWREKSGLSPKERHRWYSKLGTILFGRRKGKGKVDRQVDMINILDRGADGFVADYTKKLQELINKKGLN